MSVLVDSSAWIDYLQGTGGPGHVWIRRAIADDRPLSWTDPILAELMAGARDDEHAERLRSLLARGPLLAVAGLQDWEMAARLYRTARVHGRTIRSTIDCLIAAVSLRTGTPILAVDRDFPSLAAVSSLELVDPGR